MRVKFPDLPERFMESELELNEELQTLHVIATTPEYYPILMEVYIYMYMYIHCVHVCTVLLVYMYNVHVHVYKCMYAQQVHVQSSYIDKADIDMYMYMYMHSNSTHLFNTVLYSYHALHVCTLYMYM